MKQSEMKRAPSLAGWAIAAGMGLVAAAASHVIGHLTYSQSGFVGLLVLLLAGLILGMYWGPAAAAPVKPAATAIAPAAVMAEAVAAPVSVMSAMPTPAIAEAAPAAAVSGPAAMFTSAPAPVAAVDKPKAVRKAPAKAAAAPKAAAKPAAIKAPKVKKPDGPTRLSAPRKGKADDLKEIEGIGPALEKLCNELGFYHFDQIAGWSDADVAWVDANMKTFKGRIVRDKWISQSKIIVSEGLAAFRVRAQTNNY